MIPTLNPIATALTPQPAPYIFGTVNTLPRDTVLSLGIYHEDIVRRLSSPATAATALDEWIEAVLVATTMAETMNLGMPQIQPAVDQLDELIDMRTITGTLHLSPAQREVLADALLVIEAIAEAVPGDIAIAVTLRCEQIAADVLKRKAKGQKKGKK